jgi:hypothetical protein
LFGRQRRNKHGPPSSLSSSAFSHLAFFLSLDVSVSVSRDEDWNFEILNQKTPPDEETDIEEDEEDWDIELAIADEVKKLKII